MALVEVYPGILEEEADTGSPPTNAGHVEGRYSPVVLLVGINARVTQEDADDLPIRKLAASVKRSAFNVEADPSFAASQTSFSILFANVEGSLSQSSILQ